MIQSWTKEKVRDAILGLYKKTGKLNSNFTQLEHSNIYQAGVNYFGSWKKAVEYAGFRYSDIKIKDRPIRWTKELVIDSIVEIYKKEGRVNSNFMQNHYQAIYQRGIKRFGNWQNAVEAAGYDYSLIRAVRPFRKWSKKTIVAELKRRKEEGLALNGLTVSNKDRGLYQAARRHFGRGGWAKALNKIGLSPADVYPLLFWTKDRVIKEIQTLHRAGSPLYHHYLTKNGYAGLTGAGERYFGSWKKTIEAAGFDYNSIRAVRTRWTKKEIIKEIRRLEQIGIRLSLKATQQTRADLVSSSINRFGSWSQAVDASGINYQEHCLIWSTKAWLRKLTNVEVIRIERKAKTLSRRKRT